MYVWQFIKPLSFWKVELNFNYNFHLVVSCSIYQFASFFLRTEINNCQVKNVFHSRKIIISPGIPRWRKSIIFFSVHESKRYQNKKPPVCVCGIVVEPSLISDKRAQHQQKATSLSQISAFVGLLSIIKKQRCSPRLIIYWESQVIKKMPRQQTSRRCAERFFFYSAAFSAAHCHPAAASLEIHSHGLMVVLMHHITPSACLLPGVSVNVYSAHSEATCCFSPFWLLHFLLFYF